MLEARGSKLEGARNICSKLEARRCAEYLLEARSSKGSRPISLRLEDVGGYQTGDDFLNTDATDRMLRALMSADLIRGCEVSVTTHLLTKTKTYSPNIQTLSNKQKNEK